MKKLKATNLQELAEELNAIDRKYKDNYYEPEHDPQAVYDSSELPTFGGEDPNDTLGIFSWDENHILRCADETHDGWWIDEKDWNSIFVLKEEV